MIGSQRIFWRRAQRQAPFWLTAAAAAGGSSALLLLLSGQRLDWEDKDDDCSAELSPSRYQSYTATFMTQCEAPAKEETVEADDYPNFSRHGPNAQLPKFLTPQLWKQLKDLKTPTHETTLEDMIQSATMLPFGANPPRGVAGIYAGDAECYKVFAPLLIPIIEEYHGVILDSDRGLSQRGKSLFSGPQKQQHQRAPSSSSGLSGRRMSTKLKRHTTNLNPDQIIDTQLDPEGDYILYTRMRLSRNIEGFAFCPKIKRADRRRLERLFKTIVREDFQPLHGGAYLSIHAMTNTQHEGYMARRLCFFDPDEFKLAAGLGWDWPDGRGIYCTSHWNPQARLSDFNDKTRPAPSTNVEEWEVRPPNISMWFNYDDHVWITSLNKGGDVQSVFTCLSDAIRQMELSLLERGYTFSVDPKLGFLTCSPTNIGTGLRASMSVKLVRLGRQHPKFFQQILNRLHLEARSDYAETDQRYTGIFDIANAERLGRTEVQWINIMIKGIGKLIELEKKLERGETVSLADVDDVVKTVHKETS